MLRADLLSCLDKCAGVTSVRRAVTVVQGRIPLHAKNGVFGLRTWEPEETSPTGFQLAEGPSKGAEHLAKEAWTTRETAERTNVGYS